MANEPQGTPPGDQAPPNPPAAPVIPPGYIPQADLTAAVEKARQEEKAKLYTNIDALTKANEALTAKVSTITNDLETIRKSVTPQGGVDPKVLIDETSARILQQVQGKFAATETELRGQLENLQRTNNQLAVERAREKAIQEVGGIDNVLPALIVGNTPEEVTASVKASAAEYQRIREKILTDNGATTTTATNNGQAGAPPVLPASGQTHGANPFATPASQQAFSRGVKEMPLSDYKKQRESIMANMKKVHG